MQNEGMKRKVTESLNCPLYLIEELRSLIGGV